MRPIRICSTADDPGNAGNFTRELFVNEGSGWINLNLTNHWEEGRTACFAISRKAARQLSTALDRVLERKKGAKK